MPARRPAFRPRLAPLDPRDLPAAFVVTNLLDAGPGSLRDAIARADADGGADNAEDDVITFQPGLTGTIALATQTLSDAALALADPTGSTSIVGPGADRLAVARDGSPGVPRMRVLTVGPGVTAAVSGLTLSGGVADFRGGGGILNWGTLAVSDAAITGNRTVYETTPGGGVLNLRDASLTLTNTTVAGNASAGYGGGVSNDETSAVTIVGCTVSGNSAANVGGGLFNWYGPVTIVNSTFTENASAFAGAGIFHRVGTLTVTNATVVGNASAQGWAGGVAAGHGTALTLNNTVVAGNLAGGAPADLATDPNLPSGLPPTVFAGSHNLVGDAGSAGGLQDGVDGNVVGVGGAGTRDVATVLVLPLTANGGPTRTLRPVPGGPAVDAGDASLAAGPGGPLATDQRGPGYVRVSGAAVDIGAYEVQPLRLESGPLAPGRVGDPYLGAVVALGADAPPAFAVTGGQLPPGVALAADGTLSGVPTGAGTFAFTVTASVPTGGPVSAGYTLAVDSPPPVVPPEDPPPPPGPDTVVPPVEAEQVPVLTVYNADGSVRFTLDVFEATYTGGVAVAIVDVNGDGVDDVVASAGDGGGPRVKVFDGATGRVLADFFAFDDNWRGGVSVAVTDDGRVVTGAGVGGGPRVRVFRGSDGTPLADFFAYEESWRGGVTVAAGDLTGDGVADVAVGTGPGGGPRVRVFDGATGAAGADFLAGDPADRGGVRVAVRDLAGVGPAVVAAAGRGVRAFDPFSGADVSADADPAELAAVFVG